MTPPTFIISSRLDPGCSMLGRLIRSRAADQRQGESLFILTVALLVLAFILAGILVWTIAPDIGETGSGILAVSGGAVVLLFVGTCLVGRRPEIRVGTSRDSLTITTPADELHIPFSEIESIARIDDRLYHRHYRRYAETRAFVNRTPSELLLLRFGGFPVVLGLDDASDLTRLEELVRARTAVSGHASSPVDAA